MDPESEHRSQLIEAATRGDDRALESLIVDYLPRLRAFVRSRMPPELRRRESCSDLVQSVIRELLANADKFSFRGETQFRGWLFTSALHLVLEKQRFHRAQKRDLAREVEAISEVAQGYASIVSPSQEAVLKEEIERLESAFDHLSEEHREVISLVRIAELPLEEAAERMGRSPDAVRKLLGRALLKLGALLERRG